MIVGLKVRDCTSGYRAIRASILRSIDLENLHVQGYAFLVALLYEATLQGAKVKEIPITFSDRTAGVSKLGLRDVREFIVSACWLRFRSSAVFIKFLVVGASGVLVNLGAFTLLLDAGVNKYVASPIAIELSILTNFALNAKTKSTAKTAPTIGETKTLTDVFESSAKPTTMLRPQPSIT